MIYVSQDQLTQVEYLINQSKLGNHVLFETEVLKEALNRLPPDSFSEADAYSVEHHLENIILKPTLAEKRAYLKKLDSHTFDLVIRTYLNIVENNLLENAEVHH